MKAGFKLMQESDWCRQTGAGMRQDASHSRIDSLCFAQKERHASTASEATGCHTQHLSITTQIEGASGRFARSTLLSDSVACKIGFLCKPHRLFFSGPRASPELNTKRVSVPIDFWAKLKMINY